MSDLASLLIKIQTQGGEASKKTLDDIATSGGKAEKATVSLAKEQSAAAKAADALGVSHRSAGKEVEALSRSAATAAGSLLTGNTNMEALGRSALNLTRILPAVGTGFIAIGVAAVSAWNALEKFRESQERVIAVTHGVGAAAGVTADAIERAAHVGAEASRISVAAAQQQAVEYAKTGRIGSEIIVDLANVTQRYADATGTKAVQAVKDLGAAFADPDKGAHDLALSLGILNAAQLQHIQQLEREGDHLGAQRALYTALDGSLDTNAVHVRGLAGAWEVVRNAADDAYRAAVRAASGGGTPLERLQASQKRLSDLQVGGIEPAEIQLVNREAATLRELTKELNNANAARTRAASNRTSVEVADAIGAALPKEVQLAEIQSKRAFIVKHLDDVETDRAKGLRAIASLDKQAADLLKDHTAAHVRHARAVRDTADATGDYIARLQNEIEQVGLNSEQIHALNSARAVEAALLKGDTGRASVIHDLELEYQARVNLNKVLKEAADNQKTVNEHKQAVLGPDTAPTFIPGPSQSELEDAANALREIDSLALSVGSDLEDAFGRAGGAIGGVLSSITDLHAKLAEIDASSLAPDDKANRRLIAQAQSYGDLAASAKNFFHEGSKGYKALETAEKVYRAFEFAAAVKSIFFKGAETAATVASEGTKTAATLAGTAIRTPAKVAEGAASMFASLGPFGFPAVAAMLAVMAAVGFSGGGGGSTSVPTSEERQKTQGTGSVLGDASAKSDSIAKSLELVEAHTNKSLEFYNPMVKYLRSIDSNIGALTNALAKSLSVGGNFDVGGLGLGSSTTLKGSVLDPLGLGVGGLLSKIPVIGGLIKSLFGTKTTTTLQDQGLNFNSQTLEDVLNGGISGSTYQTLQVQKKKKFFGIGIGGSTKTQDVGGALPEDVAGSVTRVIESLRDGVLAAASVLGIEGADKTLDAFQIELGKISLKDLKPEEISDTLNAVFSKLGDQMAGSVVPALEDFQRAGEGLFETLNRIAREDFQVLDVTLASIDKTFGAVGISSIAAREHLIELAGGIDALVENTNFFSENFLSDVERLAPIQKAVETELTRLGLSGLTTKAAFKDLVLGLDVSTEAGAEMYAALLNLAPAFQKVVDFTVEGSKDISKASDDLKKAFDRDSSALQSTIDKFNGFADSLRKFRQSLTSGPNALLSPEAAYNASKAAFTDTAAKARLGDEKALGDLQGVSQAYLDASKAYYASSGNYFKDLEAVKGAVQAAEDTASRTATNAEQQLSTMKSQLDVLGLIEKNTATFAEALAAYQSVVSVPGATGGTGLPTFQGGSGTGGIAGLTSGGASGAAFDPSGYGAKNPDVAAAYSTYQADQATWATAGYGLNDTLDQFLADHYRINGKSEGRSFGTGGSFTVGGSGPKDFGPVTLHGGEVANISHRDTMTAVVVELQALRKENSQLQGKLATILAKHGEATVDATRSSSQRIAKAVERGSPMDRIRAGGTRA